MGLIDTHTHLDSFARHGEVPAVLHRAREAGLEAMVSVGTDPDDWSLYQGLAREYPGLVYYTAGLHPCSVGADWAGRVAQLPEFWEGASAGSGLVAKPPCPERGLHPVALGEIGLDRFHLPKDATEAAEVLGWQRAAFAAELSLAKRLGCPMVIHSRGAFHECVGMIDAAGVDWRKVVFHCFTEGPSEMAELTRRGGCGSFTGVITYKNAEPVRAAARVQGLARLMIETDAPYLTPMPHRGKPNEPAFLRLTAEYCAGVFGVGYDELAAVTTKNARDFFGLGG